MKYEGKTNQQLKNTKKCYKMRIKGIVRELEKRKRAELRQQIKEMG